MSTHRHQKRTERKRRIADRLRERHWPEQPRPMFRARNIHDELAERDRGLDAGGIGALHLLARQVGIIERLDAELHLLKRHLPYHESDHVLYLAYNLLSGGTCLEKGYENLKLLGEDVAEFEHAPTACRRSYRMIVVRKRLAVERGQTRLFEDYHYFFSITHDRRSTPAQLVALAHGRGDQENLIAQLKSGVHVLRMPVGDLVSHWAYRVMASLAWTLKAWFALLLPMRGRWKARHQQEKTAVLRMEFKRFVNAFVRVPALVVRTGRRVVFRVLAWNPWQGVFLRAVDALRGPLRC